MDLSVECQNCFYEVKTLYDFMSKAIECIVDGIENSNRFIDFTKGIPGLESFEGKISCIISNGAEHGLLFEPLRIKILNLIDAFECTSDHTHSLAILYAILKAIDQVLERNELFFDNLGPLDSRSDNRFRVYWFMPSVLDKGYSEWIHRNRAEGSLIHKRFKHFTFFDSKSWKLSHPCDVPIGILTDPLSPEINNPPTNRVVRFGISPFSVEKNFEIENFGNDLFRLKYPSDQSRFITTVEKIVDKVIKNKCDFFVLPEFQTSQPVLEAVSRKIKEAHEKGNHTPTLTFAGSQWTDDDNNVLTILDREGDCIGTYYKYSPFRKDGFPTEGLSNPGKICQYFGVKGLGVLLPSICRDTIDNDYTIDLVKELLPLLVVVPAWSTSSASFDSKFDNHCKEYFASTVLANACSARQKEDEIGHCRVVFKKGTVSDSKKEEICKDGKVCKDCDSGCLFIAEFCFGYFSDKRGFVRPTLSLSRC